MVLAELSPRKQRVLKALDAVKWIALVGAVVTFCATDGVVGAAKAICQSFMLGLKGEGGVTSGYDLVPVMGLMLAVAAPVALRYLQPDLHLLPPCVRRVAACAALADAFLILGYLWTMRGAAFTILTVVVPDAAAEGWSQGPSVWASVKANGWPLAIWATVCAVTFFVRFLLDGFWLFYRHVPGGEVEPGLETLMRAGGSELAEFLGRLTTAAAGDAKTWASPEAAEQWRALSVAQRGAALVQARHRALRRAPYLNQKHFRALCPETLADRMAQNEDGVLEFAEGVMGRSVAEEMCYIKQHSSQLGKVTLVGVPVTREGEKTQGMLTTTVAKAIENEGRKEGENPVAVAAMLRLALLLLTAAEYMRTADDPEFHICVGNEGKEEEALDGLLAAIAA
eukprot:TRINITY_DN8249_c0_g1_i1.p1 TRINITY_DN8249_c0_g1~~TRINITY_DN8249_c0_g1_i1.p1  ORF type:complete len:427 (+),score=136.52 TRINITY_DN8249_c0_g1_i1:95-1282(+)